MTNAEIAEQLSLLGKLMDIHGTQPEQAKILGAAAFTIDKLDQSLEEQPREMIGKIRGLWGKTAERIIEILDQGQLNELTDLLRSTPEGVIEMLQIKGIGPKKIHLIWKEMGIETVGELLYACQENRLTLYKGFGEKTQQNVRESIEYYLQHQGHFLWAEVEALYPQIEGYLKKCFGPESVAVTGSYRRQDPTIEELAFVIKAAPEKIRSAFQTAQPPALLEETSESILYQLTNGLKLRLYNTTDSLAYTQFSTTAEKDFLEALPSWINIDRQITSETAIFQNLNIPYLPPALRSDPRWLNPTQQTTERKLIETSDIRGIIHSHSKWSDGSHTLSEMADEAIKSGFEYLVISDHSRSAFYANGLSEERIREQHTEIDSLNRRITTQHPGKNFQIFKSIEADILNDGELDYPDEVLKTFDLVIASVHSQLNMSQEKAMSRLIKAIENPFTTILGHPTGRLLLSRKGYPIDHKKIIDACLANGVAIELNAHPRRLDIDWRWIPYVIEKGGWISIDPDAHELAGFNDIRYGVMVAQKGGLTAEQNLSSLTLHELRKYLSQKRPITQPT